MDDYELKDNSYFSNARTEIGPIVSGEIKRVLDIGCGAGATSKWLKDSGICSYVVGVELVPNVGEIAKKHIDDVIIGRIEEVISGLDRHSFDMILCMDVLEHLNDPWDVVARLHGLLATNGFIIASIPNVRYWKVLYDLIFFGKWEYQDMGILDRTHLRFFTKSSAIDLMETNGGRVNYVGSSNIRRWNKFWWVNLLTFGVFKNFLTITYLIKIGKND